MSAGRTAKAQAAITRTAALTWNRRQAAAAIAEAQVRRQPTSSWWLDASRQQLQERARAQQARMSAQRPHREVTDRNDW